MIFSTRYRVALAVACRRNEPGGDKPRDFFVDRDLAEVPQAEAGQDQGDTGEDEGDNRADQGDLAHLPPPVGVQ